MIRFHDVVCYMEIYIGENSMKKCVFREGQMFQQFPDVGIHECKTLSVWVVILGFSPRNGIGMSKLGDSFPRKTRIERNFTWPHFCAGVGSRGTQMKSSPLSLWELRQLKFLNLRWTEIKNVAELIGNLSSLLEHRFWKGGVEVLVQPHGITIAPLGI